MADKTINQLTSAGALSGTEEVPIWQTGATVKTTASAIAGKAIMTLPINKDDGTYTYQFNGVSGDSLIQVAAKANTNFNTIFLTNTDGVASSSIQLGAQTQNWDTQWNLVTDNADPGYIQFIHNGNNSRLQSVLGIPAFGGSTGDVSWDAQTPAWWMREPSGTWIINPGGPASTFINLGLIAGTVNLTIQRYTTTWATLSGNTTFTINTPPTSNFAFKRRLYLTQGSGGGKLVTWPTGFKWPGGTIPTLSAGAGAIDCFDFETIDGGSNYYATTRGLNFQ